MTCFKLLPCYCRRGGGPSKDAAAGLGLRASPGALRDAAPRYLGDDAAEPRLLDLRSTGSEFQ